MSLVLATYNILADAYVRPDYFRGVDPQWLDSSRRRVVLHRKLSELDADILCLQEVQGEVYTELCVALGSSGYVSAFARKGSGKADGCAIFVRRMAAYLLSTSALPFSDGFDGGRTSGHVALWAVVESGGRRLGVVTTHLKWDPGSAPNRWAVRQVAETMATCDAQSALCDGWIVCGDFNERPDGPAVRSLIVRGFEDGGAGPPESPTCFAAGRAERIDYVFHTASVSLRVRPGSMPALPIPSAHEPSDHVAVVADVDWS